MHGGAGEEPGMVRRALVGEVRSSGQRVVHLEARGIGEDGAEHAGGRGRFQRAVEHGGEVRGDEVQAPVLRVGRRHAGGRVGGPHGGGAGADAEERILQLGVPGRLRQHLLVAAAEPQLPERAQRGPLVRRQHGLADAERGDETHLAQALQRGAARVRRLAGMRQGGHVAVRQARVVVRGADQPVEVVFERGHALGEPLRPRRRSGRPARRRRPVCFRLRSRPPRRAGPPLRWRSPSPRPASP